jgi:hypothetical protein
MRIAVWLSVCIQVEKLKKQNRRSILMASGKLKEGLNPLIFLVAFL